MLSEERKREIEEILKNTRFPIPPEVSCRKEFLSNGQVIYVFRHEDLGDVGRLLILPNDGESQFVFEVTGFEDDPMIVQKKAIIDPISKDIFSLMISLLGEGKGTLKPYSVPPQRKTIEAEHITCAKCGVLVALIIYAPDAVTRASLEDYAGIMFPKVKELNVSTWVLGKEQEVVADNQYVSQFLSLKIWPERKPVWYILATEMDDILEPLVEKHCE
jgi:hypothetical protein